MSRRRTVCGRWTSCAALAAENSRRFWARPRCKVDREQRILGLRAAARKSLQTANPRDRGFFEAYARGVNAYIASSAHKLPIEFRILGYTPKPWLVEDSLVIANEMVKDLNYHYFYDALAREKILAKLGPDLTADLYVNRSWHDRPPTVMREDLAQPDSNYRRFRRRRGAKMIRPTTRSRSSTIRPQPERTGKACR